METALWIQWAWCPECNDYLVHKKRVKLTWLRCPTCNSERQVETWICVPLKLNDLKQIPRTS